MPRQKYPTSKLGQLRSRLFALIAERPNVRVRDLRAAIGPDASPALVVIALSELIKAKRIERPSYGRYRGPLPPRRSAAGTRSGHAAGEVDGWTVILPRQYPDPFFEGEISR